MWSLGQVPGQNNCWPCSESQLANKEADSKSLQVGGQVDAALKPCGRDFLYYDILPFEHNCLYYERLTSEVKKHTKSAKMIHMAQVFSHQVVH